MTKLSNLIGTKTAIHCPTQELHDRVYEVLKAEGYTYDMSDESDKRLWVLEKWHFCFDLSGIALSYYKKGYCEEDRYTIISASDFLADNVGEEERDVLREYFATDQDYDNFRGLITEMVDHITYGAKEKITVPNKNFGAAMSLKLKPGLAYWLRIDKQSTITHG